MTHERTRKPRLPLDEEGLERLGLLYAGRYATTRSRLGDYLRRKLADRGWQGEGPPPIERLVERFAELGYVDDRAFAAARAAALTRRGYGERRVSEVLRAAGIAAEDSETVREEARESALAAALRFAERRRLGPYAAVPTNRDARHKAMGTMLRAGHPIPIVRLVLDSAPGEFPETDPF